MNGYYNTGTAWTGATTGTATGTIGGYFGSTTVTNAVTTTYATTGTAVVPGNRRVVYQDYIEHRKRLQAGEALDLTLPDGARLVVTRDGSWCIDDEDQTVLYKSLDKREFNPCINASDLLEDFIRYVRSVGVKKEQVSDLPVSLFIKWLIVEAMRRDQEDADGEAEELQQQLLALPAPTGWRHRCGCGRFISKRNRNNGLHYCNGSHADHYLTFKQEQRQ